MPSFLLPIALILYSIVIVMLRTRLKSAFNGPAGFRVKRSIFGLIFLVPFTFAFGVVDLYSKSKFYLNYDTYAPQCLSVYKGDEAEVLSIEYEATAVFVKFKNKKTEETFWCENDDGKIQFF